MAGLVNSITGGSPHFDPQQPKLVDAVTTDQVNGAQTTTQDALKKQQDFLTALAAQNGMQNQSNVFGQLQGVANGTGPNPAAAMLNNSTGANIAATTAAMAGQRGASANPALIARQAAQQGANTQQQAVGQGAALQANQSLNALGAMGNIAGQQVNNQATATNALNQAAQNNQGQLLNAVGQNNATKAGVTNTINGANAQLAGQGQAAAGNLFGNIMGGAGAAAMLMSGGGATDAAAGGGGAAPMGGGPGQKMFAFADGGKVKMAGPRSKVGQHFKAMMAAGGKVPALLSPGEKYLPPSAVKAVEKGVSPMAAGQTVPGKAKVAGAKNSYSNDTVPAKLDSGGIVLPRSVTQAKDSDTKAHAFVAAILAKKGKSIPKRGK